MGNYLSWPSTRKVCESGSNGRLFYGLGEMQGWRISMEDAHAAVLDLDGSEENSNAFFAVYDGHGGSAVAKFAGQNLHKRLVGEEAYKERNWEVALKKAFLGTDEDVIATDLKEPSGCTAIAALVTNDSKIYVANAGDSRSVISVNGEVKSLSFDHKPTDQAERSRILQAGGFVENCRVNGNLAMSRSLGDFQYKRNSNLLPESQVVTANPDVTCHEVTEEDEFLILACDGIWDCMTSQQVVDFVRYQVSEGKELTEICEMMFEHCLAPDSNSRDNMGCDNMSLLIVGITHGRTKEGWYDWVKERVKNENGYKTPSVPPQLYAQYRLTNFRTRREVIAAREKEIKEIEAKEKEAKEKEAKEEEEDHDEEAREGEPKEEEEDDDEEAREGEPKEEEAKEGEAKEGKAKEGKAKGKAKEQEAREEEDKEEAQEGEDKEEAQGEESKDKEVRDKETREKEPRNEKRKPGRRKRGKKPRGGEARVEKAQGKEAHGK